MATKKTAVGDTEPAATDVPAVPASVAFTDTVFTSRSLFLQQGEVLRRFDVAGQRVTVPADDAEALAFLDGHADLQRLDG